MASPYTVINDLYLCDCGSLEHQFVFQIYDFGDGYEEDPEDNVMCSLSVFLAERSFWHRLKVGLAYIFGHKSRYGHFDTADIDYADAQRLIEGLQRYRSIVEDYKSRRVGND